jgi:Transposase DDE domain
MTDDAYAALPETIVVRETRYHVSQRGCRTRVITLASTLLDPIRYPAADLAKLYGQRWQIELNFRHLKQTLKMDVLHCKTVDGVMKELTVYALVYNLIRLTMLEAARRQKTPVARISFIDAVRWLSDALHRDLPLEIRQNPDRPGRSEPRVVKRRPKPYKHLNKPRTILRKHLRQNNNAA